MSGEPKTLTLEEFMAELGNERNVSLARYKYPDGTEQWAANDSWGNLIEWAHTWPELGTKLWGVPVVARDEAAELRAAVREYFAAWDDFEQREAAVPREERSRMNDRINAAWDVLRRLAGGESEEEQP